MRVTILTFVIHSFKINHLQHTFIMIKLLLPLFLSSAQLIVANYAVFDIFSSESECDGRANVQASIRREMGVCINLPPDFPTSFFYSTKKSYRFDSCANTYPQLSLSFSGNQILNLLYCMRPVLFDCTMYLCSP